MIFGQCKSNGHLVYRLHLLLSEVLIKPSQFQKAKDWMKKTCFVGWFFLLASSWSCLLFAQNSAPIRFAHCERFDEQHGLGHNSITDFIIDENDFAWIHTIGQLQLFDGLNFVDMGHLVEPGIGTIQFSAGLGSKWFALKKNVIYRIGPEFYFSESSPRLYLPETDDDVKVSRIIFENRKYLFISHSNDSLYQLDKEKMAIERSIVFPFQINYSLSSFDGHDDHLIEFLTDEYQFIQLDVRSAAIKQQLQFPPVSSMIRPSTDTLVCLESDCIRIHTSANSICVPLPESQQDFAGEYFELSGPNTLYVALRNGIYQFNLRTLAFESRTIITGVESSAETKIRQLHTDRNGHLYYNTMNTGLVKMYMQNAGFFNIGTSTTDKNFAKCVRVSERWNVVLMGTNQNGLYLYDTLGNFLDQFLQFPNGETIRFISTILKINDDRFLILGNHAFLLDLSVRPFQLQEVPGFDPAWIGYYDVPVEDPLTGRYYLFNHKVIIAYRDLPAPSFHVIEQEEGFRAASAVKINSQIIYASHLRLRSYDPALDSLFLIRTLPDFGYIRSVEYFPPDKLLMATDIGLMLVPMDTESDTIRRLYDKIVYAVQANSTHSEYWFGTDNGLYRLGSGFIISHYAVESGIQDKEFNTNCIYRSPSGKMYFGGVNGVTCFYPDDIGVSREDIIPYVASLTCNNELLARYLEPDEHANFSFPYRFNHIGVSFLGKGNRSSLNYNYQFRIPGLHAQWVDMGRLPQFQFHFSPGRYQVYYHVSNYFEPDAPLKHFFQVHIRLPFYRQWWFVTGILLVFSGMTFYFIEQRRKRQLMKMQFDFEVKSQLQKERMRMSRDLHDNIGAQMATVKRHINFLTREDQPFSEKEMRHKLNDLETISTQINQELRDTIWAVQNDQLSVGDFISRFKAYVFKQLGPESPWRVHYDEKCDLAVHLGALPALNLHRICQEAFNNILKHADATDIRFRFTGNKTEFRVAILDNGKGFDAETVADGHGLRNIRYRAEQIGAQVYFNREVERGSSIEVLLSLK